MAVKEVKLQMKLQRLKEEHAKKSIAKRQKVKDLKQRREAKERAAKAKERAARDFLSTKVLHLLLCLCHATIATLQSYTQPHSPIQPRSTPILMSSSSVCSKKLHLDRPGVPSWRSKRWLALPELDRA